MNQKAGLDYYSFDVDFFQDEKIQFISARFGTKGEAITIRLLCKIYRNGYFAEWNNDIALLFAKGVGDGCRDSCVNDVVYELLKRGFFEKSIFDKFSILTSRGIQKRYFEAASRRRRVEYIPELMLCDTKKYSNLVATGEDAHICGENVNILDGYVNRLEQSKVKESKEASHAREPEKSRLTSLFCECHGTFYANHGASEGIGDWVDIIGAEAVEYAILFIAKNRGRKPWGYIEPVLREWDAQGLRTKKDIEAYISKIKKISGSDGGPDRRYL
jgi:DnaD/phage-associated family protein